MTLELEFTGGYDAAQRNFDKLDRLVVDTGGRSVKIRFGTSSATWTAAVLSVAVVVPHGLGVAPGYVGIQTKDNGSSQLFSFKATADATNLTVTGYRTDNTAQTGTIPFYWLAIG